MRSQVIHGYKRKQCMILINNDSLEREDLVYFRGRAIEEDVVYDDEFAKRKPVDKVWLMKEYPAQSWSLQSVLQWHREMVQPKMLNSMDSFVWARLRLDMTTAKKVRIFSPKDENVVCGFLDQVYRNNQRFSDISALFRRSTT